MGENARRGAKPRVKGGQLARSTKAKHHKGAFGRRCLSTMRPHLTAHLILGIVCIIAFSQAGEERPCSSEDAQYALSVRAPKIIAAHGRERFQREPLDPVKKQAIPDHR